MERRDERARFLAAPPVAVAEPNGPELLQARGVLERERFHAGLRQVVADLLLERGLHALHRELGQPHRATRRNATSCGATVVSKPSAKLPRSSRRHRSRTRTVA